MKFEVWPAGTHWEVGFFKRGGGEDWVCLNVYPNEVEAQAERLRLIGGNTPPVRHTAEIEEDE